MKRENQAIRREPTPWTVTSEGIHAVLDPSGPLSNALFAEEYIRAFLQEDIIFS